MQLERRPVLLEQNLNNRRGCAVQRLLEVVAARVRDGRVDLHTGSEEVLLQLDVRRLEELEIGRCWHRRVVGQRRWHSVGTDVAAGQLGGLAAFEERHGHQFTVGDSALVSVPVTTSDITVVVGNVPSIWADAPRPAPCCWTGRTKRSVAEVALLALHSFSAT